MIVSKVRTPPPGKNFARMKIQREPKLGGKCEKKPFPGPVEE